MYIKPVQNPADKPINEFLPLREEQFAQTLTEQFEKIARRYPHRIAVKMGEVAVTYAELNAMSNRVARAILAERASDPEPIGLFFARGVVQIAGVLGVLKAGKFFVLLDSSFPKDRIALILEDSQAKFLIADEQNILAARQAADNGRRVMEFESISDRVSAENLELEIPSKSLAYIVYTSGSTGRPKGVVWNHLNKMHSVMRRVYADHMCAEDRVAVLSSGTANAVTDIFVTLLNGAALLPFDVKDMGVIPLVNWLVEERITVCYIASPLFRRVGEAMSGDERFPDLRLLWLRSEAVYKSDVDLYKKHFPPTCLLINGVSSGETGPLTEYVINHDTEITDNEVPLGHALAGLEIRLVDDEGRQVGYNEVGEIVVRSRYLFEGYWRRPDLTEAKYKLDPNGGQERLYLTGDLGLMRPDGCLLYKGRKDFRVKVRGYGVEVAEVEKRLLSHPTVREAVVVARQNRLGESYLVAYFTAQSHLVPTVSELRGFLLEKLADYMVPSAFVMLEAMPLTPNGKLDRTALPGPDTSRPQLDVPYAAPRTPIEERLVEIWQELLGVRPIGIHDNFFDLGGHSLAGASLISRLNRAFGLDLAVRVLFEAPTVAQLTSSIEVQQRTLSKPKRKTVKEKPSYLVELQSGRGNTRVFFFPGGGGSEPEFFIYAKLARHVGTDYSFYGLRARGADGKSEPHKGVEEMAADYIQAIRTVQPHGPYFLVGECFGGIAAHEAARQLQAEGERIALLALMDTQRPTKRIYLNYRVSRLFEAVNYFIRRIRFFIRWIRFYWKHWCALDYRERIPYLFDKVGKTLRSSSAPLQPMESKRSRAQAVVEVNTDRRTVEHIDWIRDRYRRVLRWHNSKPYEGQIHLLVNEKYYSRDRTLGWGQLALKGLEIHKLPGDHDTYIREHVKATAQELSHCLDTAASEL
jgi:amino acid adenylation domain-containing protein